MAGFLSPPRIDSLISSADVLRTKKPGSYLQGSISSYTPSVSEGAEQKITGLLSYVMPRREAAKLAHKVASFADFTPVGDAVTAAQAGQDFRQGNILSGLGNTAMAAIGVVPGVGDVAAKGLKKGIRAYHGSPHDFDKFSLSKIGTGEGAQAYGHGLYFAENPDVAASYRQALVQRHAKTKFDGRELAEPRDWWKVQDELEAAGKWRQRKALDLVNSWQRQGYDAETAGKIMRNEYRNQPEMIAAIDEVLPKVEVSVPEGRTYEVNINADPESLLDWDKPLSAQGDAPGEFLGHELKRYLGSAYEGQIPNFVNQPAGELLSHTMGRGLGGPRLTEQALDAGIPGIQYLDQGSRQAGTGSRNFVIFDDSIIDILNKY